MSQELNSRGEWQPPGRGAPALSPPSRRLLGRTPAGDKTVALPNTAHSETLGALRRRRRASMTKESPFSYFLEGAPPARLLVVGDTYKVRGSTCGKCLRSNIRQLSALLFI